jgi:hypothetical protein
MAHLVRSHHLWHILRSRLRHATEEILELQRLIIIGLIIRYHRIVRVEAIMACGLKDHILCVLELHLGPSEGTGPVFSSPEVVLFL